MVRTTNVSKSFQSGSGEVHALRQVSLEMARGEFVALMGPSGCGKTTLLHILGGLDRCTGGEVYINEVPVHKLGDGKLTKLRREQVGIVFQFFNLLPTLTVLENITLPALLRSGAAKGARLKALQLLDEVDLAHRAQHFTHQLSGGEMQRAAIARALINDPALLLADEPTGNLDSENSLRVLNVLRQLGDSSRHTAILMVTHSAEVAGYARRVIRMRDGRMLAT